MGMEGAEGEKEEERKEGGPLAEEPPGVPGAAPAQPPAEIIAKPVEEPTTPPPTAAPPVSSMPAAPSGSPPPPALAPPGTPPSGATPKGAAPGEEAALAEDEKKGEAVEGSPTGPGEEGPLVTPTSTRDKELASLRCGEEDGDAKSPANPRTEEGP